MWEFELGFCLMCLEVECLSCGVLCKIRLLNGCSVLRYLMRVSSWVCLGVEGVYFNVV